MGNVLSEGEDEEYQAGDFLEPGFNLDSPDADQHINFGTAAPNCQPKHTRKQLEVELQEQDQGEIGQEVAAPTNTNSSSNQNSGDSASSLEHLQDGSQQQHQLTAKHRRSDSSLSEDDRRKKQHLQASQQQQQKKLSYIQMAKLGYQELVNAIIRPPRAEYKVTCRASRSLAKVPSSFPQSPCLTRGNFCYDARILAILP
jgi:hypothetical protein